jgi:hypothetical protein
MNLLLEYYYKKKTSHYKCFLCYYFSLYRFKTVSLLVTNFPVQGEWNKYYHLMHQHRAAYLSGRPMTWIYIREVYRLFSWFSSGSGILSSTRSHPFPSKSLSGQHPWPVIHSVIVIKVTKSRVKWAEHVARIWVMRSPYKIVVIKREGMRPLWTPKRTYAWENNIKMCLKEIGYEVVCWIHLAQNRD